LVRQPKRDPYDPPPQFEPHQVEGFNRWDDVTPPVFEDADTPEHQRVRLLAAKFESSSREAEIFIHDPLATLVDGEARGISSVIKDRSDLPPDPYITTLVINHHRTLSHRVIRATAMVDDESVGITIHKERGS
jgi:hypothetical protein